MLKSALIALALCVCFTLAAKTKVSVYYESLCPDSANFITTQLTPAQRRIGDRINLEFIPFGFASAVKNEDGTYEFTCQHGPGECYGNKVHSCALTMYPSEISNEFVKCAMASGDSSSDENLQRCAAEVKIAWASLDQCLTSGRADELLVANGVRTNAVEPSISFMPTIIYNDVFSQPLEELSFTAFEDIILFLQDEAECGGCHIK